jgi:hypothetical protein
MVKSLVEYYGALTLFEHIYIVIPIYIQLLIQQSEQPSAQFQRHGRIAGSKLGS